MPGLVAECRIITDLDESLKHAIAILLTWHHKITHYALSEDEHGNSVLHLYWTGSSSCRDPNTMRTIERKLLSMPFDIALSTPEAVYTFAMQWLKGVAKYGANPEEDADGSSNKGWMIEAPQNDFYEAIRITTAWVYYSK